MLCVVGTCASTQRIFTCRESLTVRACFALHGLLSTLLLRERFSPLCTVLLSRGDDCMYVKRDARDDCETARLNTVLQSFDDARGVCSIADLGGDMAVVQRLAMSARDDSVLLLHTFSCCAERKHAFSSSRMSFRFRSRSRSVTMRSYSFLGTEAFIKM